MTTADDLVGHFIVGPFSLPANDVLYEMDRFQLWMSESGDDPQVVSADDGIRLRASGPDVWAYFLGEDGREADRSLIDLFWLATKREREPFFMTGTHMLSPTKSVIMSARGCHDGRRVTWDEKRLYRTPLVIHDLATAQPEPEVDCIP